MNDASPRAAMHVVVRGRVQGVGFRWFIEREARRLRLDGWVRNLPTGEVELRASGERASLEALLARARQGPPGSRVEGVEVEWSGDPGAAGGFRIRS